MPREPLQEFTCYWIINVESANAEDAAQQAEEYMTDRTMGSVWHVVPGLQAAPEGAIEIETWEVNDDDPHADGAPAPAQHDDAASVPAGG